jgi:hypothetical protein
MTRFAVALILFAVLSWPTRAQTFIRSLPTSTNVTSATKVPVDDATYGTRAITVNNLLVGVSTNPAVLAAITNVVTDVSTTLLGNKLDTTNGTAVNLTGSLSNISLGGTTIYSGAGSNDLTANTLFNLGLRGVNGETVSVYPTAHTTKNIASLVGLNTGLVTTNATVEVRGYYEPGDGGGGVFYYGPFQATNRGMVFQAGSASFVWNRLADGSVINVKWFGAKGDGVTDDTAALDSARDWAQNSARTSGVSTALYLPRGNYLHSGNFTVAGQIKLKGDGLETSGAGNGTTIVCTGDNTPAVSVSGQGFGIEDLEIRYQTFQDSTKTNSVVLKFSGDTYKYKLANIAVRAGYDAIAAAQLVNVYNGTADNVFVRSYSHSGVRMLSGGTVNTWNNLYVQNLANVQVTQTATITNVALANGTNITLTCSGSLPSLLATNRQFAVSGLDSGYNGNLFVRAISGSVVYCDAASTLSAPSDITGTLTFFAQPATGYPIELGNGEHTFIGLDVEHVVTDAAAIIYAPSLSYVHIVDAHIEAVYRSTGGLYLVHSPNGSVEVGSLSFINSGFNPGSANYTFRNESTMSSLVGGNVTARDIAFTGATWHTGSAGTGADHPMVDSVKAATTYRANATGTPTGDGSLRFRLGGGNKATGSSGTDNIFNFQPTVTESGTARYFGWMINPTATTLGSGTSYPLWVGENSTNYYRVSNRGSHVTEADTAQTARFIKRGDTGDEVQLSYGSATDRKLTIGANSIDVVVKSTSAAANLALTGSGGSVTIAGVKAATQPTTETLTYSTTNVTITAGKGPMQRSVLTVTNNFQLLWSGLTDNDGGVVHLIPDTTNRTILISSPGRAAGSTAATATGSTTLTITGATNGWAELAWSVVSVGGTNRVSVNLGAY